MKQFPLIFLLLSLATCGGQDSGNDPETSASDESCTASLATDHAKGFNFTCWYKGCFQEEETEASLDALRELGGNWLAIVPTWYQDTGTSTSVYEHSTKSSTAEDLRSVVALARRKGFKILLKPHVDVRDGSWRGYIAPSNLADWQQSYENFILTQARLAAELGIETLAIGTELKKRSGDEAFWRGLIREVRKVYHGSLTYAANWDEFKQVKFWDQLDAIGIDFYYPLTDKSDATQAEMEIALATIRTDLKSFSDQQGKPFLFTEIGYRSVDGTNVKPYEYGSGAETDLQEQADAYAAVLSVFGSDAWIEGMFWWRWDPRITAGASDEGYFVYNKPAADTLKSFWTGAPLEAAESSPCDESDQSSENPVSDETAVSFITFGDWGTGGDDQKEVAQAIQTYCQSEECEFILTLGDNFYSSGVESTTDEQWQEKYADVYGALGIPFYASLGNHDNDGNIQAQIDYSAVDSSWHMPGEYYSYTIPAGSASPLVEFFVFNSDYPHFRDTAVQAWLEEGIDASKATWKLLVMHHPIYSNGKHGDDDQGNNDDLIPIICNKIDLVLSGHDHNFAYLRHTTNGCAIEQLVIGTGGASIRSDTTSTEATVVSRGNLHGFGWLQVSATEIGFRMVDTEGVFFYTTTWEKP